MARIILSYRRSDSATMTQLIFSRLAARYGEHFIFMDIDNIPFGVDFRAHIRDNVRASDLLLAISQSGETADTLAAVKEARSKGAQPLGIANVLDSSIAGRTNCSSWAAVLI